MVTMSQGGVSRQDPKADIVQVAEGQKLFILTRTQVTTIKGRTDNKTQVMNSWDKEMREKRNRK